MKFDIPFSYLAGYIPPRKRNHVDTKFGGTTSVDIPVANDHEAPMVIRWTKKDSFRGDKEYEVYAYEGGFYTPVFISEKIVPIEEIDIRHLAGNNVSDDLSPPEDWDRICHVENHWNRDDFEHVVRMKRESAELYARQFVVIDGKLCRATSLPTISAKIDYFMGSRNVIRIGTERLSENIGAHGMMFPIWEMGPARAWAEKRKELEDAGVIEERYMTVIYDEIDVEILEPAFLQEDDTINKEVLRICEFVMKSEGKDLHEHEDRFIDAWQEWRSSIVAAKTDTTDDDKIERALDMASAFVHEADREANEGRQSDGFRRGGVADIYQTALACAREVQQKHVNEKSIVLNSSDFRI